MVNRLTQKRECRSVRFVNGSTIEEVCAAMNRNVNSNLFCTVSNNRILVYKNLFSDFFPFNMRHLASLYLYAKSDIFISDKSEVKINFEFRELLKLSLGVHIALIVGTFVYSLVTGELYLSLAMIVVMILVFGIIRFLYFQGVKNFISNWDKFIAASV